MQSLTVLLLAVLMGVLEGITEWLPVSSTGHILLLDGLLKIDRVLSADFYSFFIVFIQLGAVLAVLLLYFERLNPFSRKKSAKERRSTARIWGLSVVGILPAAIFGIILDEWIESHFYSHPVIALALIVYGILFIVLEQNQRRKTRVSTVEALSYKDAFCIGCFQVLSLIPGTSRSGSTILGGLLNGVSRTAAAEFTFFMAIPVMLGATLVRALPLLDGSLTVKGAEWGILLLGALSAFLVSLAVVRFLMDFVKKHSFLVFGWYRIILGIIIFISLLFR